MLQMTFQSGMVLKWDCTSVVWLNLKKVDTTRRGSVSLMGHCGTGGHRMRSGHNIRASPGKRLPGCL